MDTSQILPLVQSQAEFMAICVVLRRAFSVDHRKKGGRRLKPSQPSGSQRTHQKERAEEVSFSVTPQ